MLKKKYIIILGLFLLLNCGDKTKSIVGWSPLHPKTGDSIEIIYYTKSGQANLKTASQISLICQFYGENTDSTLIVPMENTRDNWHVKIKPPEQSYLISFKFEDNFNRTDDNNGRGWTVIITTQNTQIIKNTHLEISRIYLGSERPEALPYYKKAIEEIEKELNLFPSNYAAWFTKWEIQLKLNHDQVQYVSNQLDSLLKINIQNYELLKLVFNVNLQLLQNQARAIYYGEQLIEQFSNTQNVDEIAYSLILLNNSNNINFNVTELEKFVTDYPNSDYSKSAYFRLGNYFLQQKEKNKAKYMFQKLVAIAPEDFSNTLTLASLELNDNKFKEAENLLANAKQVCTVDYLQKKDPWLHPGKRQNQLNYNLCQIYSIIAKVNFLKTNYDEVIKNRNKVIELGTPFPAYEWVGIGDAYVMLNDIDQAWYAYVKALSINPDQNDVRLKLKNLYIKQNKPLDGFDDYVDSLIKEELRKSEQLAPNFKAIDLEDNKFTLSDFYGKIIILCFWNSWSKACVSDIPQLNELVKEFQDINLIEFWAISSDHKTSIKNFLKNNRFEYHQFYDGYEIGKAYKIIGLPSYIVIDFNGIIRYKYIGFKFNLKNKLKENIQLLLNEYNIIS